MNKLRKHLVSLVCSMLGLSINSLAQMDSSGILSIESYSFKTWDGREHPAELGRLWVRENRNSGSTKTIQLSFVRLRSVQPNKVAPIVFLAGGPGVPGIGMGRVPVYFRLFEKLREVADVILLDQRGTGLSVPSLVCSNNDPQPGIFQNDKTWLTTFEKMSADCAAHWKAKGIDLTAYTTEASADDLEDLRIALGVAKLSLIGHSYGTVLAQAAIRRHGDKIEKVVFANTEESDGLLASPSTWDMLIRKLSYFAGNDTSINKHLPAFENMLREVLVRLEQSPVRLTVKKYTSNTPVDIFVGKIGLLWILRNYMADARTYADLPSFIYLIYNRDYSVLAKEIEPFYNNFSRSVMATAIDCSIGWSAQNLNLMKKAEDNALFSNVNLQWSGNICDKLGVKRSGNETRQPIFSTVPALFISGTLDTNTPPAQGEALRWGFPNSYHLVIENGGHESLPSQQVHAIVVDFFKGIDVRGRYVQFELPDFISPAELKIKSTRR